MSGPAAPTTPAIDAVRAAGMAHRVVTHGPVSSADEAAAARGIPLAALVKTIVVRLDDSDFRLVALGGDRSIDWPRLRELLGLSRLSLAEGATLVELTGYPRGAVTPFGARPSWPLIVDRALLEYAEVSIGGGDHGVALHVAPGDLVAHFAGQVAEISQPLPGGPSTRAD